MHVLAHDEGGAFLRRFRGEELHAQLAAVLLILPRLVRAHRAGRPRAPRVYTAPAAAWETTPPARGPVSKDPEQ